MAGLSLLVTLFVLSAGFEPLPAKDMMARLLKKEILRLEDLQKGGRPRRQEEQIIGKPDAKKPIPFEQFVVVGVETLTPAAAVPDSSYRVTVALPWRTKEEADKVRAAPAEQLAGLRNQLVLAEQTQYLKVHDVRLAVKQPAATEGEGHPVYFEVTTEPTPDSRLVWSHKYSLFWGGVPLGSDAPLGLVLLISAGAVLWIGSLVTLLTAVIVTAFFIPNMLRKGTIDLLLVRPVSRWALLVYKYVGGLTFVLLNTTVAILGIWLALGLRSGVWANAFLLMILVYTFFFAILYAVSALFAVLTRSSIVAILMTCGVWFVLFLVGLFYTLGELYRLEEDTAPVPPKQRTSDNAFFQVARAAHFVLPRTSDLDALGNEALQRDFLPRKFLEMVPHRESFHWGESTAVSLAFIAVVMGLACWRFSTKDY
jgi:ABC-type transport system involved in multi-copper enzyme maturation permease subunit